MYPLKISKNSGDIAGGHVLPIDILLTCLYKHVRQTFSLGSARYFYLKGGGCFVFDVGFLVYISFYLLVNFSNFFFCINCPFNGIYFMRKQ